MEPTSKLPKIWILMSGIPQRRIGDFLAMWSLGTLFGKTLKVDMKYTREKGVLWILVGCLEFRRIPVKERIFIADGFYDISFEVEAQRDLVMTMEVPLGKTPLIMMATETMMTVPQKLKKTSMPWRRMLLIAVMIRKALKMHPRTALTSTSWLVISLQGSNSLLESNI
jgi:hypothetical protein